MGTGFDVSLSQQDQGIVPRAVHQLFEGIQTRRERAQEAGTHPPEFKVSAQFLEVCDTHIHKYMDAQHMYNHACNTLFVVVLMFLFASVCTCVYAGMDVGP